MTDLSRRSLLKAGALTVMLAPLTFVPTTNLYARSRFGPFLNQTFDVSDDVRSASMTLTRISDLAGGTPDDDDAFALTFRASAAGPPQGTYSLNRPGFARTLLFLVPDGASLLTYQAIINRSLKAPVR
jgi:hypothetical protein